MGLESVKEEILNNAKEQAASLIAEARKDANAMQKEAEKRVEEAKEKIETETKRMIDIIKKQEFASVESENKKMLLEAKKEVIESVFSQAKKTLESIDDKQRDKYIKKILERTKNEIEIAYIYCNKRDIKFLKGLNVEPVNIIGGLMAENREKNIRVDYSFETILQNIKDNELQNLSKILFFY